MEEILKKLNPWWFSIKKDENLIERSDYFTKLKKLLNTREIITITGIRRVGKSTLQFQLINYLIKEKEVHPKNILFFNIDALTIEEKRNARILDKIKDEYFKICNPKGKIYFFLDEIQNLDGWENSMKSFYDIDKGVKFILTGSNSKILYSELSRLLTGRILNVQIFPLSFKEFLHFKGFHIKDFLVDKIEIYSYFKEYLLFGGFPEVVLETDEEIKLLRLREYYNSILLRDVLELNRIRDGKLAVELSKYFINLSSKFFSFNKIANILRISKTTASEYYSYFENAFLFHELNKFDFAITKQIRSEKKTYIADTGLINAINLRFSQDYGRLLENLVLIELKRKNLEIFYHKKNFECDFAIKQGLQIVEAIQVTKSISESDNKKREINGLLEAMNLYKLKQGLILTQDEDYELEEKGRKITVKPVWKWLLE